MSLRFINFRDLGGLPSRDGGVLQSGRLFRSGQPHDQAAACDGGDFALVIDLRYAGERARTPVAWPTGFDGETLAHGFEPQTEAPHIQAERLGGGREGVRAFYRDMYATLPLTAPYGDLFGAALRRMAAVEGSVLVHCTAGKDRTGMLVALALYALGIERGAIMTDFMRTRDAPGINLLRADLAARLHYAADLEGSDELLDEFLAIRPDYLESTFDAMTRAHGSIDGWLDSVGLTADRRAAWRAAMLQ
jgi:protein-tyrosine phosphatase